MMNEAEALRENWNESTSVISSESPRPLTPMSSRASMAKIPKTRTKTVATKTMMKHALKALCADNSRKGFSLASIRKYIMQHYLATETELKPRMRHIKTFVRNALERGDLSKRKGNGLNGSFRVPSKSSLHGKARKLKRKTRKTKTQRQRKSTAKHGKHADTKWKRNPTKKTTRKFSASC